MIRERGGWGAKAKLWLPTPFRYVVEGYQDKIFYLDVSLSNFPSSIRFCFHRLIFHRLELNVNENRIYKRRILLTFAKCPIQVAMFFASLALVIWPLGVLKSFVGICLDHGA